MTNVSKLFAFRIQMPHAIDDGAVRFLCPDREQTRNALEIFETECARIILEELAAQKSLPGRCTFKVGDRVKKEGGDYKFRGEIVAIFAKRGGAAIRIVVENDDGMLFIFNEAQLLPDPPGPKPGY